MRPTKFTIVSVDRKKSLAKFFSFGDWGLKHPQKRKRFDYTILGDDGNTYHHYQYKTSVRLMKGQIVRCFSSQQKYRDEEDGHWKIEYHSLYKGPFLTEYMFEKAIEDYIGRHRKSIDWEMKEIERLEKLKATPSTEVAR